MKWKAKISFFFLGVITLLCFGFLVIESKNKSKSVILVNRIKTSNAGTPIEFDFQINNEEDVFLFIHNSFGKTILKPNFNFSNNTTFILPENFTKRAGILHWRLIQNEKILLEDTINILPLDNQKNKLEGYLGPPSTWVGDGNYVMFVNVPLDQFDNSLQENTPINFQINIHKNITNENILVKDLITWKKIYSPTKSGKIFVNADYKNKSTKEFEAVIYPSVAMPFSLNYNRIHDSADGNQITTITTSILKDKFGNVVSNGTLVVFEYTNSTGECLKSFGSTIDGIATTSWVHPEKTEIYTVKARISGLSESNTISLNYKTWDFDIEHVFSNKNRKLKIGPLLSYMKQWIANGTKVTLKINDGKKFTKEIVEKTINGEANFVFEPHLFPNGTYNFEVETLGKKLMINNIQLK